MEKLIIIGSGPGGHAAAIYAGRANLEPLLFEGFMAGGVAAGGQLTTTTEVENYPGFESISGPDLMDKMRAQSLRNGARIETRTVDRVELGGPPFRVHSGQESWETHSVIVATGATARRLKVPNEQKLWNKGVSACAVCDGALPMFRNKVLYVIGGGDTAVEESTYLTKFASKVYLVHRRDALRASKVMQRRAFDNPKLEILWNTVLEDVLGEEAVTGVRLKHADRDETRDWQGGGLFYAIGHTPNTGFLDGQVETDEQGYILTKAGTTRTSVEGVFAAGDVQDKKYRQAVTSAGTGCMAALDAEHYLASKGLT